MLGRDLFEQMDVDIDFAAQRVAAHHPDHFAAPADARSVPLLPYRGLRSVPVSVEGRAPIRATFDLGSNAPLILAKRFADQHRLLQGRRVSTTLSGGAEGANVALTAILPSANFGGTAFADVPVIIPATWSSPEVEANVGMGLLSRFRLITDYKRDRLFLIPAADASRREFRRDRSGLRSRLQGDRLIVGHVSRGSPAEAAGWRAGEQIVAVNGWRIGSLDFTEERSFWASGPAGTQVRLTVADGSERRLVLANYY